MKYFIKVYRNKYTLAILALVSVLAIITLIFFSNPAKISRAASVSNLNGWAWSSNIGWVSLNCQDTSVCSASDYKVQVDSDGKLSGYAWSSNIGWIQFNPAGPYPESPQTSAVIDLVTGVASGWLRALSYGGGWDGWIKITDAKVNSGKFEGWAWGSLVVGWLNFGNVNISIPPGDFNLSLGGEGGGAVACNSVPLSWTAASGADAYRILRGSPRVDISPYQPYTALNFIDTTVSQNTTYLYQIEAYNAGGGTKRSNEINVTTPYCPPTVSLSANPMNIFQGQSSTLTWSSTDSTSCTASGSWSGSKALSGSEVIIPSPPPSATYNLTCSGLGGSTMQSVTINITSLLLPDWREIIPR